MHDVVGEFSGFHRGESSKTHVQSHECEGNPLLPKPGETKWGKVEPGSRCGDRSQLRGENCLITFRILFVRFEALDVRRKRDFSDSIRFQGVEKATFWEGGMSEAQLTLSLFVFSDQGGRPIRTVSIKIHDIDNSARIQLAGGSRQTPPDVLFCFLQEEQFDLTACGKPDSSNPCGENLGIVKDQKIFFVNESQQIQEASVGQLLVVSVEDE